MKHGFIFVIGLLLFACTNAEEKPTSSQKEQKKENNFTIEGKVENGQNITFYLEAQSQNGTIPVAQTTSDGNGRFAIEGHIPGFGIYQLRMGETPEKVIPLTLVPGDNVEIQASYASFVTPKVSGTDWSGVMTEYMNVYHEFKKEQTMLQLNPDNLSKEEANAKYMALRKTVDDFALEQMDSDPSNPFNIMLLPSALPQNGFNDWTEENLNRLKRIEQSLMDRFPESPFVENLDYQIYQIEQQYEQHMRFNAGTLPAPEIALPNPDGEIIRLSDLKGQYVLVDFWASWCGPCRRENPNVVRLYNKYKNKGFTVFSVSLDENGDAWKAAIEKDNLTWPNHCSDLKRWESPVIQDYGFTGIPYTVLLNKEGKFIAVNLRGNALEQKLKEIFEK
jgi:thiol-disulfide isomerase/thioredoxin